MKNVDVSVFMLTYNQESYITQAIEGVLMQETTFNVQLVIGDDCSTDGTRKIVADYAEKNPGKIKLILHQKNIGLIANYVETYTQCSGKFVAICDGDDYWIDPLKLQKQVDFLSKNEDYKMVFSNNYNLFPSGKMILSKKNYSKDSTSFNELIFNNYIPSVTSLFYNEKMPDKMKKWILQFPFGDWPTYLFILRNGGLIKYLDQPTAVYRKNFGTSTALRMQMSQMGEINLAILQEIIGDDYFTNRKMLIKKSILKHKTGLMASYNREGKFLKSVFIYVNLLFYINPFKLSKRYLYSLKISILSLKFLYV